MFIFLWGVLSRYKDFYSFPLYTIASNRFEKTSPDHLRKMSSTFQIKLLT